MRIDGAIFDLDGTLLDSMFVWNSIGSEYLLSKGIIPRENLNETFKNMSLYQAALYYQSEYGLTENTDAIIAGVNQRIAHFYENEVPAKPGVPEALETLKNRGVKMCIATATDLPLAQNALKRCGIRHYFGEIFTCQSVGHGKNEPHIFNAALTYLGTPKDTTWVFEDALYAARTAKAAGFKVAAVYDKSEAKADQVKVLSHIYLRSLNEMEDYLNEKSTNDCRI